MMKNQDKLRLAVGVLMSSAAVLAASAALAETLVQKTVENRVLLAFQVDQAALQQMLPEGWVPVTLPKGPVSGSNLILSFFDKLLIMDPEGKPDNPATQPVLALVAYGKAGAVEGVRTFVTAIYEVPPVQDPFGLSEAADIERVATMTFDADGRRRAEEWTVRPESGGAFSFSLDYEVAGYGWSIGGESIPFSAANPDFRQIYRYDQLVELAMNTKLGRELNGEFSYTADIPALSGLFNGAEELISVISVPVYVRDVYR